MLPYLRFDTPFPSTNDALSEPNGLLAAGADLSIERLINAYSLGIFPWYSMEEPILWWSPDPRTVFLIEEFKVHKSVLQTLKKYTLSVTLNNDFQQVIQQCSQPRSKENGRWITDEMIEAYIQLHKAGYAHSVEVWQDDILVGGIYGVATNSVFCGESMFSDISNGSKIALSTLVYYLKQFNFQLIDCQVENPHLVKLGSVNIPRTSYLKILTETSNLASAQDIWLPQNLNPISLFALN